MVEFLAQQFDGVVLDQDFGLEIEPCIHAQRFVPRPSVAIRAAVLAAAVGIDAEAKADIGAVVLANEGGGVVRQERRFRLALGGEQFVIGRKLLVVGLGVYGFEAIGGR